MFICLYLKKCPGVVTYGRFYGTGSHYANFPNQTLSLGIIVVFCPLSFNGCGSVKEMSGFLCLSDNFPPHW